MNKVRINFPHPLVSGTFLVAFVFYYFNSYSFFTDPDVGWHIKSGDLIRSLGGIPSYDPWAFDTTQKWYNIAWLWDVIISGVSQYFGLEGLRIFYLALYAAGVASICLSLLMRKEFKEHAICATMIIILFVIWSYVSLRPQIVSLFMTVLFSYYLHKSRKDEECRQTLYLILPCLMIAWVNMHGAFLNVFVVGAVYLLEACLYKNYKWLKFLVICGFLCVLAMFINPYGFGIITATLRTLDSIISVYIQEWHPMQFATNTGETLALMVFILVSNSRDNNISFADKVLAFLWLFAGLWSKRYFMFFAVFAAPYLACCLGKIGRPSPFPELDTLKLRRCFGGMAFVVFVTLSVPYIQNILLPEKPILDEKTLPIKTAEYIVQNLADKKFLNSYDIGGHLIYFGGGKIKIFIDGRAGTVYSEERLSDAILFYELKDEWENIIQKYSIDAIVVDTNSLFFKSYESGMYTDKWKKVFLDRNSAVFLPILKEKDVH